MWNFGRGLLIALIVTIFSSAACCIATAASAQSIEEQFAQVEKDLPSIIANPAKLAFVRGLVAMQLDYRIGTNFLGYEAKETQFDPWPTFNATFYADLPKLSQALEQKAGMSTELTKNMIVAYESNKENYDVFLSKFLESAGISTGVDELKREMLSSMMIFAIANGMLRPATNSDWFSKSYAFPFCWPQKG